MYENISLIKIPKKCVIDYDVSLFPVGKIAWNKLKLNKKPMLMLKVTMLELNYKHLLIKKEKTPTWTHSYENAIETWIF